MGSKAKAKEFIEVSEVNKHYANIIEFSFTYFLKRAEAVNPELGKELKKIKDKYPEEFAKGVGLAEQAYCEMFTDEELDELIVIHTNPVLKKLRNSTATLMKKISEKIF